MFLEQQGKAYYKSQNCDQRALIAKENSALASYQWK
jgi:hypothetical protein